MKYLSIPTLLLSSTLFLGCTDSNNTATYTGQLVDSYIENVDYICDDNTTGITDINGRFECPSLPVSFKMGGLELGKISSMPDDNQIFPQDLLGLERSETHHEDVVAMARFFQSCDEDNNSLNGLKIHNLIKERLTTAQTFDAQNIDAYVEITVDEQTAIAHLEETTDFTAQVAQATAIPVDVKSALLTPHSALTQEVKDAIAYMIDEERVAFDVYNTLYATYPTLRQLNNIATNSESVHIQTVELLASKYALENNSSELEAGTYDIALLQELYDSLIELGESSEQKALEVGCMVEVTDIDDLNTYILSSQESNATDVTTAFEFLRDASYKHYWAFDKGLVRMGVSEGCCSLGDAFCHSEYPQR